MGVQGSGNLVNSEILGNRLGIGSRDFWDEMMVRDIGVGYGGVLGRVADRLWVSLGMGLSRIRSLGVDCLGNLDGPW